MPCEPKVQSGLGELGPVAPALPDDLGEGYVPVIPRRYAPTPLHSQHTPSDARASLGGRGVYLYAVPPSVRIFFGMRSRVGLGPVRLWSPRYGAHVRHFWRNSIF